MEPRIPFCCSLKRGKISCSRLFCLDAEKPPSCETFGMVSKGATMTYIKLYTLCIPLILLFVLCPFIVIPTGVNYLALRRPVLTYALLALLFLAGVGQFLIGPFLLDIPANDWSESFAFTGDWSAPWRLWTYTLCHHNALEVIACLVMLYYFGPPLEERLKWPRLLAFYLAGCVAAPLLYGAVRDYLNVPMGEFYGFSIPLIFLLGIFFVLMPWSDIRIRYVFWLLYVFLYNGTFLLASLFAIGAYLFIELKVVLPDDAPPVLWRFTPDALLLLSSGLLGFVSGCVFFGFKRILKGEAQNLQDEGRVQRSLQRAIKKASAQEAALESGASPKSTLPPARAKEEKPEAAVPPLQSVSPTVRSAQPPSFRFADRLTDACPAAPSSAPAIQIREEASGFVETSAPPTRTRSEGEKPAFGLRPLGENLSDGSPAQVIPDLKKNVSRTGQSDA